MRLSSKFIILFSLLLSACSEEQPSLTEQAQAIEAQTATPAPISVAAPAAAEAPEKEPSLDDPNIVVIVNGTPITKTMYAIFFQQWSNARQGAKGDTSQEQVAILNELINAILITQEAEANDFDKRPEVAVLLDLLRTRAITEMSVANYIQQKPISEQVLRKLYDEHADSQTQQEFKARHILLATKDDATAVITELNDGADFIALAKTRSTGPSASQGGALGWFSANQMVKPFSNAVAAMTDGSHSIAPVETKFGWHVIFREEGRKAPPPPFKEVQERLLEAKRREIVMAHIEELRNKADIQFKPQADADPASATPAQPVPAQ